MADFQKVGENLVRHTNGTIYLRAKIGGKCIRESLKLQDLRLAKIARDSRLAALRSAESATTNKGGKVRTMRQVLEVLRTELVDRPNIEAKTKAYCKDIIRIMEDSLPLTIHARTWTRQEAQAWWVKVGEKYSASVANKVLGAMRKFTGIMIEHGLRSDDPARELKRMPAKKQHRKMPGRDDMKRIVEFIRNMRKQSCVESSHFVAFLAFSGMRRGELTSLRWEHIGSDWITVGATGNTKSKTFRMVPVSAPLQEVIDDMRKPTSRGEIFHIASPRHSLRSACAALGLPRMRVHDLRHFFATWAIESGVDIPTVSRWLGHKDGGALAMKTYGHLRDDHSLSSAAKLK